MIDIKNYEIFSIHFYTAFSKLDVGWTLKAHLNQNSYNSSVPGPHVAAILDRADGDTCLDSVLDILWRRILCRCFVVVNFLF